MLGAWLTETAPRLTEGRNLPRWDEELLVHKEHSEFKPEVAVGSPSLDITNLQIRFNYKWHPQAAVPHCRLRKIRAACPTAHLQQQHSGTAAFTHSFSKKAFCEQGESYLPSLSPSYVAHLAIGQGLSLLGKATGFFELQECYTHA